MSAQVLPRELRLVAPPTMPKARSYLFKVMSTKQDYLPGDQIQINIPRLQRSYLTKDSYLKFQVEIQWNPGAVNNSQGDVPVLTGGLNKFYDCIPTLDSCGAYGFFNSIEVKEYLGSTTLEQISGHNQLAALLIDTAISPDERSRYYSGATGLLEDCTVDRDYKMVPYSENIPAIAAQAGPPAVVESVATRRVLSTSTNPCGQQLTNGRWIRQNETALLNVYGAEGAATLPPDVKMLPAGLVGHTNVTAAGANYMEIKRTHTFAIPLISFLNLLSPKYAPLHNGYTICLNLDTIERMMAFPLLSQRANVAPTGRSPTSFRLRNPEFCAQVLELGDTAEIMVLDSVGNNPLIVPTKTFRRFEGFIPATANYHKIDLNLNVASLTNILFFMRPTNHINNLARRSLGGRYRNYLQTWWFQYGSSILPQTSGVKATGTSYDYNVDCSDGVESFNELFKARHAYNVDNHKCSISRDSYVLDAPVNAYDNQCSFFAHDTPGKWASGLDLELIPGRGSSIISGLNTNGMNTSLHLQFHPNPPARAANSPDLQVYGERLDATLDVFCEYDAFINITPLVATTVSF